MTDLLELEEGVSDINVAGDWIFFINKADDYRVWAMRTTEVMPVRCKVRLMCHRMLYLSSLFIDFFVRPFISQCL